MKRVVSLIVFGLLMATAIFSQSSWSKNEKVFSENKMYYANIRTQANNVMELEIFDSINMPQWSSWIDWNDSLFPIMANDGSVFITVNMEYTNTYPLVTIYKNEKLEAYSTKAIVIGQEYIKRVGGKLFWIKEGNDSISIKYGSNGKAESLEIKIVNDKTIAIKL